MRASTSEWIFVRLKCGQGEYIDFQECTRRSLAHAAPGLDAAVCERVMEAYTRLDAYEDVAAVIEQLASDGRDMIIFTNGTSKR